MIIVELSEILSAKNMSYKELSKLSGVPESYVLKLIAGTIDELNLKYADAICRALEVSPYDWLIYMDDWMWKDEDGNQITQEEDEVSDQHIAWLETLHGVMGNKIAELKEKRRKNTIKLVD